MQKLTKKIDMVVQKIIQNLKSATLEPAKNKYHICVIVSHLCEFLLVGGGWPYDPVWSSLVPY